MRKSKKLLVLFLLVNLVLLTVSCNDSSTKTTVSFKDYNWEHNTKVPEDKKKLLSEVIKNGEVIRKLSYDSKGRLALEIKRESGGTKRINYFYNEDGKLKKKKTKRKGERQVDKIVTTYKYNQAGKLIEKVINRKDENGVLHKKKALFKYDQQKRLVEKKKYNMPDDLSKEKKLIARKRKKYDQKGRVIYKKLVNKNNYIDMEWRYKYNKYDKLIYKQILSHGKEKLLKKYTNEQEPKILVEKEIRNGRTYKYNVYKYNNQGKLIKKIDKSNSSKIRYINHYYNKAGLLKSKKTKVKGKIKYIEKNYYNEKEKLKKKKIFNKHFDYKKIIKYKENKKLVKGLTKGKLTLEKRTKYDEKERPIRIYTNDIEDDKKQITEYRYDIENDMEWKCKLDDKLIWWYEFDVNRKKKQIEIIKKDKKEREIVSTYFKYNSLDKKINVRIHRFLNKNGEGVTIEEIKKEQLEFDWYRNDGNLSELKSNILKMYLTDNVLSKRGYYYDEVGNKLYESYIYNVETRKDKTIKYNYIFKEK